MNLPRSLSRVAIPALLTALLLLTALPAAAQDVRGSISGVVKDPSGGVLPGVSVTVTNTGSNVSVNTVTDAKGFYQARYLIAGVYSVTAKLAGFQTVIRSGIEVHVSDAVTVPLELGLGRTEQAIVVTAEAPILDSVSAASGQVIDSQQIKELPLADGTAYMLSRLAPGVWETGDLHFSRPADNAGLGSVISNGVKGGNDFTIDGAPNTVSTARVGFSPPADAISEFKVQTNAFDAQQGHTAGAVINLALRSGGNAFQGSASYFNRSSNRSGNSVFAELAGQSVTSRDYNRYSATLSGPVFRDKTFFMASYENLKDLAGEPTTYTVPTLKMRNGDFSELLASNIKIYDPLTGTTNRTAFPNNVIPSSRLNPIAMKLLSYYPAPNQPGNVDGTNNYYSPQDRTYSYQAALGRIDHNFTGSQTLALTGYWNFRTEDRYDWAGPQNGFDVTRGFDIRDNTGATLTYTNTFSADLIGDLRGSYSKFGERRRPEQSFDPATLGFSPATASLFRGYQYLPRFDIAGFATLGALRSDYSQGFNQPFYNYSVAPTVTYVLGSHTVRAGYDLRIQDWNRTNDGLEAGRYNFTGAYTRQNNSAAIQTGQSFAQFLLGLPTSGGNSYIDVNTDGKFEQRYHALFVHDQWTASQRLTLNLGVRLEVDEGLREQDGRNISGFDLTVSNPLEAAARAAYAKNPIPEIAPGDFHVPGGLVYTGSAIYKTLYSVLPRAAASYLINDKTVLRGGVGLFTFPYNFDAINQTGFSQQTLLVSTDNNGSTFLTDLTNPFPNGLGVPPGSSQGLLTSGGRDLVPDAVTSIINYDRKAPIYTRWQIGTQRDLGKGWAVELDYIGSHGSNLPVRRDLNGLPLQYTSFMRARDTTQEAYLSANVPNPFAGLLPGTTLNGATIQRQQLIRAYPEYLRVAVQDYNGSDSYNAGELAVSKRFDHGLSIIATYTYSKLMDQTNYFNTFDTAPEKRISPDDRPNRATIGLTAPIPFGKGRTWGSNMNGILDAILGGWNVSATYQYQQGYPLSETSGGISTGWRQLYFDPSCDPKKLSMGSVGSKDANGKIIGVQTPAWDVSCFYFHDAAVQTNGVDDPAKQRADPRIALGTTNARYFPSILDNMRMPDLHLIDVGIAKNFELPMHMNLQLRVDFINAINYTVYFTPDMNPRSATFGEFTTQRNNPRDIQVGGRLTF
jgi:Carboxypeptidase regulatory-like domain